jgi:hypothetical protein
MKAAESFETLVTIYYDLILQETIILIIPPVDLKTKP